MRYVIVTARGVREFASAQAALAAHARMEAWIREWHGTQAGLDGWLVDRRKGTARMACGRRAIVVRCAAADIAVRTALAAEGE